MSRPNRWQVRNNLFLYAVLIHPAVNLVLKTSGTVKGMGVGTSEPRHLYTGVAQW